ncbi:MAG: hypothetical protein NTU53_21880 [Planctomycetota bacterium]|nr:hypothetical protein [Planctomycetota bacterium]
METGLIETSGNDLRLAHALILNAAVLFFAFRFVRRSQSRDWLAVIPHAMLCWFLVQYLSVTLPGLIGILNRWTLSGTAALFCTAMWFGSPRQSPSAQPPPDPAASPLDRHVLFASILFLAGYLFAIIRTQWYAPVLSDDALTYHLPAAIRWLQTGAMQLHEVWFFNPANTYSPLAGSTFAAWWFAPMGNDYLARFLQIPALILIFFAMLQLCRELGATVAAAALIALGVIASRSFISQVILAKDDLYLGGFFLIAILATSAPALADRLGPYRLGAALGLMLATKITSLLALPMLLLLIDAPYRAGWRWRRHILAAATAGLLAGPWFLRNWWLTGNPLYPTEISVAGITLFPGLFRSERSLELRSIGDVWRVITAGYFKVPIGLFVPLVGIWAATTLATAGSLLRNPLRRACLIGPVVGLVVYVLVAPFAEVRFLNPAFLLLLAAPAVLAGRINDHPRLCLIIASVICVVCIVTGMSARGREVLVIAGVLFAAPVPVLVGLHRRWPILIGRGLAWLMCLAGLGLAMGTYVYFDRTVADYAQATPLVWAQDYGKLAEAWTFVRHQLPPDKTLAYANTYYVYPLFGFAADRNVVYAPTRPGIAALHDLPPLHQSIPGEKLRQAITLATIANPDRATWLANLNRLGAAYLFLATDESIAAPPELRFIAADAGRFEVVFRNDKAIVYKVRRDGR